MGKTRLKMKQLKMKTQMRKRSIIEEDIRREIAAGSEQGKKVEENIDKNEKT